MRVLRRAGVVAVLWLAVGAWGSSAAAAADAVAPRVDGMGREYFVYAPPRVEKGKTYWLVVGVHGYGGDGRGAAGLAEWAAKRGDCVVVGPSFPNDGYQLLHKDADAQLLKVFDALAKEYALHGRMFLYGFSGGAQFAHRFMMAHPDRVAGCSAHSAGSWATGEPWGAINPAAADVPLAMSCGDADTARMAAGAPFTRIEWAKEFERQLAEKRFAYHAAWWPGVAHAAAPGVRAMTDECYALATRTVPAAEALLAAAEAAIAKRDYPAALRSATAARRAASRTAPPLTQVVVARLNARADEVAARVRTLVGKETGDGRK